MRELFFVRKLDANSRMRCRHGIFVYCDHGFCLVKLLKITKLEHIRRLFVRDTKY